ncbi:MAG: C1 family peptidase [Ramlibacter sp.]
MADTLPTVSGATQVERVLDARADTLDFRDRLFEPTLIEVPAEMPLAGYLRRRPRVLDQGTEGACTGFGLAGVANFLLSIRKSKPDPRPVSPRMLYELARRYDEWPGEAYSGSSARGAMKGWHKHGVCSESEWPYEAKPGGDGGLTRARTADALRRPLGAYQRVNHRDLVAMHCALAEVGILFATATVHQGWSEVDAGGGIRWPALRTGGHAFAIVAYDAEGFWIQNSWGPGWGRKGFARVGYDDWLANGTDVWVARLGAPVVLREHQSSAIAHSAAAGRSVAYSYADLRPHVVSLGNDGALQPGGDFGTSPAEVERIFREDIPAAARDWPDTHVLLYAHGGLVPERTAVQRVAEYRAAMLGAHVYPISFVWHSDLWSTIAYLLEDALRRRRPEGGLTAARDFLLDRIDDTLELLARIPGKAAWEQMKQNARGATGARGGALLALEQLVALRRTLPFKLHIVGHSAGAIFQSGVVRWLHAQGQAIDTCTLWAPACTMDSFRQDYLPAIEDGTIGRFGLFALDDATEQDDHCARVYNKSLLYLVSRSFENSAIGPGTPLLGMAKWIEASSELKALVDAGKADVVLSPNRLPQGDARAAEAREHGAFDDDKHTVLATLQRVLASTQSPARPASSRDIRFFRSGSSMQAQREQMSA